MLPFVFFFFFLFFLPFRYLHTFHRERNASRAHEEAARRGGSGGSCGVHGVVSFLFLKKGSETHRCRRFSSSSEKRAAANQKEESTKKKNIRLGSRFAPRVFSSCIARHAWFDVVDALSATQRLETHGKRAPCGWEILPFSFLRLLISCPSSLKKKKNPGGGSSRRSHRN